jgi:hypothetical protein
MTRILLGIASDRLVAGSTKQETWCGRVVGYICAWVRQNWGFSGTLRAYLQYQNER